MGMPTRDGMVLLPLIFTLVAGCGSSDVAEPRGAAGAPLENTYWKLLDVGGRPARVGAKSDEPYLQLDPAQKRAFGGTGCNRFLGSYELSGDSLRFGPLASTRRACPDPEIGRQETAFLDALGATRTWQVAGDSLVLLGETEQVARFGAQQGTEKTLGARR